MYLTYQDCCQIRAGTENYSTPSDKLELSMQWYSSINDLDSLFTFPVQQKVVAYNKELRRYSSTALRVHVGSCFTAP